jgi:hypothetical protein
MKQGGAEPMAADWSRQFAQMYTLCVPAVKSDRNQGDVMGKTSLSLFLLAGSLFAADPFVGTWKFNAAKSKLAKHEGAAPREKESTTVVAVVDGQFKVTSTGTSVDGSPISVKYTVPRTGGPIQWLEGGPPPGSGITSTQAKTKADSNTIDATNEKDGKVYETMHFVVSADGKSMRVITKGTDPQGKKYEDVGVCDKQ